MYGLKPLGAGLSAAALLAGAVGIGGYYLGRQPAPITIAKGTDAGAPPSLRAAGGPARSANRALLVGVGNYARVSGLTGIDIDLDTMRNLAPLLGYADIEVLQDGQATHANVRAALERLIRDLGPDDRALFYFSGHGAQFKDASGDEADGKDEALLLYDSDWNEKTQEAKNVLLDDELATLLAQRKNGELLMLVDACHSGTVDKSIRGTRRVDDSEYAGRTQGEIKGKGYVPVSAKSTDAVAREPTPAAAAGYISVTAARDDEAALASPQGSYFTLALGETLKAAKERGGLTPKELRDQAVAYIKNTVRPPTSQFTPQLEGDASLFDKRLQLADTSASPHGQLWAKFEAVVAQHGGAGASIRTDRGESVAIGQYYNLEIELPTAGYLSVIAVDSGSENPVVLFPNPWMAETRFDAGKVVLPPASETRWGLRATPPASKTLLVALVTPEPLNLYDKGIRKDRLDPGQKVFARLAPSGAFEAEKAMRSTRAEARAAAAKAVVDFK